MKTTWNTSAIILAALAFSLFFFESCKNTTPDPSRVIQSASAKGSVARYKARRDSLIRDPRLQNAFYYTAEVFTKSDLEAILSEKSCDGVRIFHAVDSTGRNILLIAGVSKTAKGYEDLLPANLTPTTRAKTALYDENYNIIDGNIRCPNMCDTEGLSNP